MGKSLNELRDEALATAKANGFTEATFVENLMLCVSELSEALEDYRAGKQPNETWYENKIPRVDHDGNPVLVDGKPAYIVTKHGEPTSPDGKPYKVCGIGSELADTIIRILHIAGIYGIDIERIVSEKMVYNAKARGWRHGGKVL